MSIKIEHLNYVYSESTAYEKHALKDICLETSIIMERTFTRMGTICGHSEARWGLCFNIRSISYLK